jgi:murein DD-endopeptidase MepM/ murein hydrolase activator NlpD
VVTRYAHLHEVAASLQEGDLVEAGDFIGTVGNSGTSEGAEGNGSNYHLHFEIWVGGSYLGEGLSPQETRELWKRVLEK